MRCDTILKRKEWFKCFIYIARSQARRRIRDPKNVVVSFRLEYHSTCYSSKNRNDATHLCGTQISRAIHNALKVPSRNRRFMVVTNAKKDKDKDDIFKRTKNIIKNRLEADKVFLLFHKKNRKCFLQIELDTLFSELTADSLDIVCPSLNV